MRDVVLGPTFSVGTAGPGDEAEERLAEWVRGGGCAFHVVRVGSHFTLTGQKADRHFWSPVLTLEVAEEDGPGGMTGVVRGRFNPSPGIWTGYMLTYLALLTIVLGASMWGLAQVVLGRTPWALAFVPGCAVVGGLMFWASAVGQRIAGPEMAAMESAVRGVFAEDDGATRA